MIPSEQKRTIGDIDYESLEQLLNQGLSLAEIGNRFGRSEATVGYWVQKHGLEAAHRDKHTARGGLARKELERLIESGASIATMARELDRAQSTVRHWLIRYGLRTSGQRGWTGEQSARAAKAAGKLMVERTWVVSPPWADCVLAGGSRLLSLSTVSLGGSEPASTKGEANPRGGSWWSLCALWI